MTGLVDVSAFWPEWEIDKRIGSGSYGTVYRAKKAVGETTVYSAIKVISLPFADSEVESMVAEGLTLNDSVNYYKQLAEDIAKEVSFMESCKGCNNIVRVEDFKVVDRDIVPHCDIFIRMELLTPLNTYLCDKTLSEEEVIKIGIDLCNALSVCEKRNIIHRDIKPENIFVDVLGNYKLGDFGIARSLESMTFGFSQKGTFNYMAPEVFNSSFYDYRADIYSLGIVLYRLLNHNRLPFLDTEKQLLSPSERRLAVERRMRGDEIPAIKGVSSELSDIIIKACSYKQEDRFGSAGEMHEALRKVSNAAKESAEGDEADKTGIVSSQRKKIKLLSAACAFLFLSLVTLSFFYFNDLRKSRIVDKEPVTESAEVDETIVEDTPSREEQEYLEALGHLKEGDYIRARVEFLHLKGYKEADAYASQITCYLNAKDAGEEKNYAEAAFYYAQCYLFDDYERVAKDYVKMQKLYDLSKEGKYFKSAELKENGAECELLTLSRQEKEYFDLSCKFEYVLWLVLNDRQDEAGIFFAEVMRNKEWLKANFGDGETVFGTEFSCKKYVSVGEEGIATALEYTDYDSGESDYVLLVDATGDSGQMNQKAIYYAKNGIELYDVSDIVRKNAESSADIIKSSSARAAMACALEANGFFDIARGIYAEIGEEDLYAESFLKEADYLLAKGQTEEAGPVLLNVINSRDYMDRNFSLHVTEGQYGVGPENYPIAKQYWDGGTALLSLYYNEPDGEPEAFSYRSENGSSAGFYDYDMRGNFKGSFLF